MTKQVNTMGKLEMSFTQRWLYHSDETV